MPTSRSPKPAPQWAKRHRLQHEAGLKGRSTALDPRVTERFAREFEAAVRQRGENAKAAAEGRHAA
jgi:hypothetical protein